MEWAMNLFWLIPPLWLATSIFAFRVMLDDYLRKFRQVTRGDVVFIAFMASFGPMVLPLVCVLLAGDKPAKFFSKKVNVRRKSERAGGQM
jgi:hypothetical protein